MARIFITGSSDGLGLSAARLPVEHGHGVVHARNQQRTDETQAKLPAAQAVVVGIVPSTSHAPAPGK